MTYEQTETLAVRPSVPRLSAEPDEGVPLAGSADPEAADGRTAPPLIRHGACGKGWSGITHGHCSACHETFSRGGFDRHQRISGGHVTCLDPTTAGLVAVEKPWGTLWSLPGGYWPSRDDEDGDQ